MRKIKQRLILLYYLPTLIIGCNAGSSEKTAQCNPCMVFSITNHGDGFNGDIKSQAESILGVPFTNGIAAADALCNFAESKPSSLAGASYKALLVDGVNRSWNPNINWVIYPNTSYINTRNEVVGLSTESAIIPVPTQNSFVVTIEFAWTGLGGIHQPLWQASQDNCLAWTSSDAAIYGNIGYENYLHSEWALSDYQLFSGNMSCNNTKSSNLPIGLICVQQ